MKVHERLKRLREAADRLEKAREATRQKPFKGFMSKDVGYHLPKFYDLKPK